jgi:hypothetical protein
VKQKLAVEFFLSLLSGRFELMDVSVLSNLPAFVEAGE